MLSLRRPEGGTHRDWRLAGGGRTDVEPERAHKVEVLEAQHVRLHVHGRHTLTHASTRVQGPSTHTRKGGRDAGACKEGTACIIRYGHFAQIPYYLALYMQTPYYSVLSSTALYAMCPYYHCFICEVSLLSTALYIRCVLIITASYAK